MSQKKRKKGQKMHFETLGESLYLLFIYFYAPAVAESTEEDFLAY
jgi:hypothetical protein